MGSVLFTDLTLTEQEKLSGGNSHSDIAIIMQSYFSNGDVEEVVNVSRVTTSSDNTPGSQSNSVTLLTQMSSTIA